MIVHVQFMLISILFINTEVEVDRGLVDFTYLQLKETR